MDIQVIDFILFEKKISLRRSVKSGCKHPWWIERDGKNFSYFLSLYSREGLLRFSSKPYTFSTYHEAIHICNTAIQEKYDEERRRRRKRGNPEEVVKTIRDQGWDCEKLNEYLK